MTYKDYNITYEICNASNPRCATYEGLLYIRFNTKGNRPKLEELVIIDLSQHTSELLVVKWGNLIFLIKHRESNPHRLNVHASCYVNARDLLDITIYEGDIKFLDSTNSTKHNTNEERSNS
jgi:hypothetical protein